MKSRLDLSRGQQVFVLDDKRILFEDESFIVVNKPPGLPSQATLDPKRHHLSKAVRQYLQEKAGEGQKVYVGEHQRLDLDTSGVIVFSKSKDANPGLAEQISKHKIEKVYLALVGTEGRKKKQLQASEEWTVRDHLARGSGRPAKMRSVRSGGDLAETRFRVREANSSAALIECYPRTGRTHQIRVHLSEGGLPILGDNLYAPENLVSKAPRLMLHAWKLRISHPITNEPMEFEAPLPADIRATMKTLRLKSE